MNTALPPQRSLSELPLLKPTEPDLPPDAQVGHERGSTDRSGGGREAGGGAHLEPVAADLVGAEESFWQEVEALRAQVSTALAQNEIASRGVV